MQILCWLCGAQGIHVKCGDLPLTTDTVKWKCKECLDTIKKMPKRTKHNFHKVQRRKPTYRISLNKAMANTRITVGNENTAGTSNGLTRVAFNMEDKGFCASFNLCPKVIRLRPIIRFFTDLKIGFSFYYMRISELVLCTCDERN